MESYSDVGCVLKVNVHCETCKLKLHEVLSSVAGVYDVTIDAEHGLAKISGEMDPNTLLRALGRNGRHAELKWVKLQSPAPRRGYSYNDGYGYNYGPYGPMSNGYYGYNYSPIDHTYGTQRILPPEGIWYDPYRSYSPQRRAVMDYPYYSSSYGY